MPGTKSKNKKKVSAQRKSKKRIKVHYDRLIFQIVVIICIILAVRWIINSCENESAEKSVVAEAVEAGRTDAAKAVEAPAGSMQRDEALLFILSRENELRSNGYKQAADDYIESARRYLSENGIE